MDDGVYIELFAVKNGVRYNAKIVDMKEVSTVLTNSLMDGIKNLWSVEKPEMSKKQCNHDWRYEASYYAPQDMRYVRKYTCIKCGETKMDDTDLL